jgi:hypothetical protein
MAYSLTLTLPGLKARGFSFHREPSGFPLYELHHGLPDRCIDDDDKEMDVGALAAI